MVDWLRTVIACGAIGLALGGCGRSQSVQDALDQAALRRIFGLPTGAQLVDYDGYPSMVGFGQREGLTLSAVYDLSGDQVDDFLASAAESGWQPLPVHPGLEEHIPFRGLSVPLDRSEGLYTCRTAGDDVLHATATTECMDAAELYDIVLGVFDAASHRVWVMIRSGY